MPEKMNATVERRSRIPNGFSDHASVQSIDVYLADWEATRALLDRRIAALRGLRAKRARQMEAGEWPPKQTA